MPITKYYLAVVSLFPDMYQHLHYGVIGRFIKTANFNLQFFNPRDYTHNNYAKVDDRPYGGGPGMVMSCQPLDDAINAARQWMREQDDCLNPLCIYMSPQGKVLTQELVQRDLVVHNALIILAGRYEGIDERLLELQVDIEVSVGDFIVSGGEIPSLLLIDAWIRCLPNALNNCDSKSSDSFARHNLLQHPQYTRPEQYKDLSVPEVLLSGDHQKIESWRREQSLKRTEKKRVDLFVTRGIEDVK